MADKISPSTNYIPYSDSVETIAPDEQKSFDDLTAAMMRLSALFNDRYRHAVRSVHSKSHGLLKAEVKVNGNLPPALRQGLFSSPTTYPAIIRFSTVPGDILADSVSTPRGMAVKIIGATGEMLPGHIGEVTQDFVFVNSKVFAAPTAAEFLKIQQLIEKNANDPEVFKKTVSNLARGTNALLGLVGVTSGTLAQLGHPETNLLGEIYGSCAAIRWGDYIAKIIFKPSSPNLVDLYGKHVDVNFHYSGLRDAVVEFFKTETAVWEIGVQLCVDLEKMPIEDPTVEWNEDASPYIPVGTLTALPQDAYSPARRVYCDDGLSYSPWHALAAHRPLGNIMRARKDTYIKTSEYRHKMNGVERKEPKSIDELPE